MKPLFIILCCDYIDSEQSSGEIICNKSVRTSYVVNGCCLTEEVKTEFLLHIYTVIGLMYDLFQECNVKKRLIVRLFLIECLDIQATVMQTIQCMVYIIKA